MPRKMKRGQGPSTRGRHKKMRSKETRRWRKILRTSSFLTDGKRALAEDET